MSLDQANAFAFSLAATLMTVIVIFRAGDGTVSAMPAAEYDGDDDAIINDDRPLCLLTGGNPLCGCGSTISAPEAGQFRLC